MDPVVLDFHHVNPEEKAFSIGNNKYASMERIQAELDKCVVVCANDHRRIHAGTIELQEYLK